MRGKAWVELSRPEEDQAWDLLYKELGFKPSVRPEHFPGFKEPSPSLTYSISAVYSKDHQIIDQLLEDMNKHALNAFRDATPKEEHLIALDWQHTCYKFYPHRMAASEEESWEISPLPNGDYYIFLEPKLRFGWLGHPWEQTICIFGNSLLEAIKYNKPELFRHPVRRQEMI